MLNQNLNISRIARNNVIQDSQQIGLRRYIMLGFEWDINSLVKRAYQKKQASYL